MKIEVGQKFEAVNTQTIYTVINITGSKVEISGVNLKDSIIHKDIIKLSDIKAMISLSYWIQL